MVKDQGTMPGEAPVSRPRLVDYVSMQGVPQITDRTLGFPRRFVWIIIVCGGLTFTAFNIVKQMQLYLSYPISVNIDIKLAQELPFPTITICSTNIVKRSQADQLNVSAAVKTIYAYSFQNSNGDFNGSKFDLSSIRLLNSLSFEVAHTINDSIIWSSWEGTSQSSSSFAHTFTDTGLCFNFNRNGTVQLRNSGRFYGLHVSLNALSEEFLRSKDNTEGHGFLVAVHSPDVPPLMAEIGTLVYPGSQYLYGMDVQEMNAPDGLANCGNNQLQFFDRNYSREACRIECVTAFMVQRCSCREAFMPGDASVCSPLEMATCVQSALKEYPRTKGKCERLCPQTCSYKTFNVKSRSNLVLTDEFLEALGNTTNRNKDYWRRNYVSIDFYMTSMTYHYTQKRYSYSILDLLCDIGGALGLVLGASVLTCVELADYGIRRLETFMANRRLLRSKMLAPDTNKVGTVDSSS